MRVGSEFDVTENTGVRMQNQNVKSTSPYSPKRNHTKSGIDDCQKYLAQLLEQKGQPMHNKKRFPLLKGQYVFQKSLEMRSTISRNLLL